MVIMHKLQIVRNESSLVYERNDMSFIIKRMLVEDLQLVCILAEVK